MELDNVPNFEGFQTTTKKVIDLLCLPPFHPIALSPISLQERAALERKEKTLCRPSLLDSTHEITARRALYSVVGLGYSFAVVLSVGGEKESGEVTASITRCGVVRGGGGSGWFDYR